MSGAEAILERSIIAMDAGMKADLKGQDWRF